MILKLRLIPSLCNTTKMSITNKSSKAKIDSLGLTISFLGKCLENAAFIKIAD
jgi:hypothetical protein